jgi:pimeloyl-ACP methyl ester carboxylesterase
MGPYLLAMLAITESADARCVGGSFKQYTAEISGLKIHFVHERAVADDAIPIIMLHGWPGSFHEYLPTVSLLTQPAPNKQGSNGLYG